MLAQQAAEGVHAERIADTAVATWRGIEAVLAPIIGHRGVAALYKRSLHAIRGEYPWLADVHENEFRPGEFSALQTALSQQPSSSAAAANGALLQTFHDLLTKLIGGALTERLLRPVWDNPSSGPAVHDDSP